jgi:hypothetical protein
VSDDYKQVPTGSPFPQLQPGARGPVDEEGPAPRVNNPSAPLERGGRAYREGPQDASGFPQMLPDAVGTSEDDQGFGVPPYGVARPAQPAPDTAPVPAFEDEYIALFNSQNALLRQIYDALVGRGNPGISIRRLPLLPGDIVYRVERLILVNNTAAGVAVAVNVGTAAYPFALPANTTLDLPFPLNVQAGLDVTYTGEGLAYLVGYPGNDAGVRVGP